MSNILMREKPIDSFYLGVDIDDRSYLDDASKNIWTVRADSNSQSTIRSFLADKQISQLDLLFIDGWHSVNTCVNDWSFTDMLAPKGVVLLHDTNAHPGCVALFDAVDENLFEKQRFCTEYDNGIAVFRRK
jgi:predicted O-methyltransferase YrrM